MYGVKPTAQPQRDPNQIRWEGFGARNLELLETLALRATRTARQLERKSKRMMFVSQRQFNVGDQVLVARGTAMGGLLKWPLRESKYYGPFRVVRAKHPRYTLLSPGLRYSRRDIHARRLIPFIQKPAHLM